MHDGFMDKKTVLFDDLKKKKNVKYGKSSLLQCTPVKNISVVANQSKKLEINSSIKLYMWLFK